MGFLFLLNAEGISWMSNSRVERFNNYKGARPSPRESEYSAAANFALNASLDVGLHFLLSVLSLRLGEMKSHPLTPQTLRTYSANANPVTGHCGIQTGNVPSSSEAGGGESLSRPPVCLALFSLGIYGDVRNSIESQ